MKRIGQVTLVATLLLAAAFINVQFISANTGAIWTTTGSCGEPQNINHYSTGDIVFINGAGFDAGSYDWAITGQPGGASNHPNIDVAFGSFEVDESGAFCFDAYEIGPEDGGTYRVTFGNKSDNYRVEQAEPTPVPTQEPTQQPTEQPTQEPPTGPTQEPPAGPTPTPTEEPEPTEEAAPVVAQATPAPSVAPTTGAASGPAALIISAISTLGLSGTSLGIWLKRRK